MKHVEDKKQKDATKELNPCLATVRKWLSGLTYREKLAIALYAELLNKEHKFIDGVMCNNAYLDDKDVGNNLVRECYQAVIDAGQDTDYLKNADRTEALITGFVTGLLPLSV